MSEQGQATVEWMGLVVGLALALGALAAGGRAGARGEAGSDGLGEAVAGRMACAVRGTCAAGAPLAERRRGAVLRAPPRERAAAPARPPAPVPAPPHRAGLGEHLVKRTWLLCLGYRRWQYDRAHPRPPLDGVPLRDTARMVNECANPLSFLFD